MSENWLFNIKHVTPGEPVQAGVVSRPDRALQDRTEYLRQRLDAAELGRAVFDNDATIASDVLPGQPVFWNYSARRYEKAVAAVELDAATQAYVVRPSSECVGLCFKKKAENLADIVLYGVVDLPELHNAVNGPLVPGRYYLSAVEPGKLVKQRPATTVNVCYVQGQTDECNPVPRVVVMPNTRELVDEHTHYRFDLYARPAGNNVVYADGAGKERHSIGNADSDLTGWLPADHAVFAGKAPNGAVFGYNLTQHPALRNVWPPIPIQAVSVLWDKGQDYVGATDVPTGPNGLVVCDLNGIWWMSDCYGDVPWPATYTNVPVTSTNSIPAECPREEVMRVSVVFIRMLVGNDRSVVTSLAPGEDSPVVIESCATGEAATPGNPGTGDLRLNLDLKYASPNDVREPGDGIEEAGLIVTGKTPSGRRLQRGWVPAGIVAHNLPQLSIESTNYRNLTNTEKEEFGINVAEAVKLYRGIVKLNFKTVLDQEISPQIVRLNDTVERLFMDIPYLGFPAGQASSMRVRLNIPDMNMGTPLKMLIRVQLFGKGSAATPMPALFMSYRKLSKPGNTPAAAVVLPSSENDSTDNTLVFNTALAVGPNKAIVCDSSKFAVTPGDTVLVTLERRDGDTYPEIGVLRISGILSDATTS
ncbi:hypothetical protein EBZ39_00205 [bacterium]|nr:hypothetical protein [bacterium]